MDKQQLIKSKDYFSQDLNLIQYALDKGHIVRLWDTEIAEYITDENDDYWSMRKHMRNYEEINIEVFDGDDRIGLAWVIAGGGDKETLVNDYIISDFMEEWEEHFKKVCKLTDEFGGKWFFEQGREMENIIKIKDIHKFTGEIPVGMDLVVYEKGYLPDDGYVLYGFDEVGMFDDVFHQPTYCFYGGNQDA